MAETSRVLLPKPTPETRPFWDSAKAGRLVLPFCDDCARFFFYPRPFCPRCFSGRVRWQAASGRGRLHTFVIHHRPPRNLRLPTPCVIGIVELEEGVRLMANIVGVPADPGHLRCEMPLVAEFEDAGDDIALPRFRPVGVP